jgi:hypothetical protein
MLQSLSAGGAWRLKPVITGIPIVAAAFGGTGAPGGRFVMLGSGIIFVFVANLNLPQTIGPSTFVCVPERSIVEIGSP